MPEARNLAFSSSSKVPQMAKSNPVQFICNFQSRDLHAHGMCPEFPGYISTPVSSVLPLLWQVHGKWSVSGDAFFICARERKAH